MTEREIKADDPIGDLMSDPDIKGQPLMGANFLKTMIGMGVPIGGGGTSEPEMEIAALKILGNAQALQGTVVFRGHDWFLNRILCEAQGTWRQVLLLLTFAGAQIGRTIWAQHLAGRFMVNGVRKVFPTLELLDYTLRMKAQEKEEERVREEQSHLSDDEVRQVAEGNNPFHWRTTYRPEPVTADRLIEAAHADLFHAVEILTGPLDLPDPEEEEAGLIFLDNVRDVRFPDNKGDVAKILFRVMEERDPTNRVLKRLELRNRRGR